MHTSTESHRTDPNGDPGARPPDASVYVIRPGADADEVPMLFATSGATVSAMDAIFRATDHWLTPPNRRPVARPDAATDLRLRHERTVWLGTTGPLGGPAVVPTWFTWTGEEVLIFAKPSQRKVRNVRREPRVMLALGDPEDDFDVQLIEGHARLLDQPTAAILPDDHRRRYGPELARMGLEWDEYAAVYRQPIAVTPTRFLPWRGRSARTEQLRATPVLRPL